MVQPTSLTPRGFSGITGHMQADYLESEICMELWSAENEKGWQKRMVGRLNIVHEILAIYDFMKISTFMDV